MSEAYELTGLEVAVVGMAGQFPQADSIAQYWQNLLTATNCISQFDPEQLQQAGVTEAKLADDDFVPHKGVLNRPYDFDNGFFGYTAREAATMDPQLRTFHQTVWHALEDAGHFPSAFAGQIGLFAGAGNNTFWLSRFAGQMSESFAQNYEVSSLNGRDFLATRIAYALNLTGPAVTLQTACSTSLVAVHYAVQSLLAGESDLALAGGVAVHANGVEERADVGGYSYQEGMILSPNGTCRAFDVNAQGTVQGDGMAVVALRRYDDAVEDGDRVYAVIKGTGINNDGKNKVGYTAPSHQGQASLIRTVQDMAEVESHTIDFIENHGTGTPLGDPIEIQALKEVFAEDESNLQRTNPCLLGSVKSNIGHLDAAAGVAGFVKAVLAIYHRQLPPTLHIEQPNPKLGLDDSPFALNRQLHQFAPDKIIRGAVSAFGIGGTNAHVILEQFETPQATQAELASNVLLPVSAKSETALSSQLDVLTDHLMANPSIDLTAAAQTLVEQRSLFDWRGYLVASNQDGDMVIERRSHGQFTIKNDSQAKMVWMFPGQGSQYGRMALSLYRRFALYHDIVEQCLTYLPDHTASSLRTLWLAECEDDSPLSNTQLAQPALFICEYALAKLLQSFDLTPDAMIGHSLGEYVAATLAGVFSLEDAVKLVVVRAKLMNSAEQGAMTSVMLPEHQLRDMLDDGCYISAVNSSNSVVVAGSKLAIEGFEAKLTAQDVMFTRLRTSHAYHTPMMADASQRFSLEVAKVSKNAPNKAFISNVTGEWITEAQATSNEYWAQHITAPVNLAKGWQTLLTDEQLCLVEVGPGRGLSSLVAAHDNWQQNLHSAATVLPIAKQQLKQVNADETSFIAALGHMFQSGFTPNWSLLQGEQRTRVALPNYAFENNTFEPPKTQIAVATNKPAAGGLTTWQWQSAPITLSDSMSFDERCVVIIAEDNQDTQLLAHTLTAHGADVIRVAPSDSYQVDNAGYQLNVNEEHHFELLLQSLIGLEKQPSQVIWALGLAQDLSQSQTQQALFHGPVAFARQWEEKLAGQPVELLFVTTNGIKVHDGESLDANKALLQGPMTVLPQEVDGLSARHVDIKLPNSARRRQLAVQALCQQLLQHESGVAIRYPQLWTRTALTAANNDEFNANGHYLIIGASGGMGSTLATHLAKNGAAKLTLTGRQPADEDSAMHGFVEHLTQTGVSAQYIQTDVLDSPQVAALLRDATANFGAINTVIYCPGVADGTSIHRLTQQSADAVFAPKLAGLDNLVAALQQSQVGIEKLVLCSSITALLGGFGQTAYTAANAYLDATAHSLTGEVDFDVVSLNWDTWAETGMAVGHSGLRQFAAQQHLIGHQVAAENRQYRFSQTVSPDSDWLLNEHWIMGKPTMAGATYLELVREAVTRVTDKSSMSFADVYFMTPLVVAQGASTQLVTELTASDDNHQRFEFLVKSGDNGQQVHARGVVNLTLAKAPAMVDMSQWAQDCDDKLIDDVGSLTALASINTDAQQQDSEQVVTFGAHWNNISRIRLGDKRGIASMSLPTEYRFENDLYLLHPSMLDVATAFLRPFYRQGIFIPLSYGQLDLYLPLPAEFETKAVLKQLTEESDGDSQKASLCFDLTMVDAQGNVLLTVTDFVLREIDLTSLEQSIRAGSAPTNPLLHQDALTNEQALALFDQAMSSAQPQLLLSQVSLAERQAQMFQSAELAKQPKAKLPRPTLSVPYVAAKKPVEKKLAAIWQDLIGLESVGIEDDFFELGGNSLLLVQFHKQLKSQFEQVMPVVDLYSHTTVAKQAELLEQLATQNERDDKSVVSSRAERQRAARGRRRSARR